MKMKMNYGLITSPAQRFVAAADAGRGGTSLGWARGPGLISGSHLKVHMLEAQLA